MRAASAYELLRSELQQAQQDAADMHMENVRLKAQLAALQWTPITPETRFEQKKSYILHRHDDSGDHFTTIRGDDFQRRTAGVHLRDECHWLNFRAINPPDPSGVQGLK